ncbi:MAG: hypothetical protein GWP91_11635 [Rhodobacterales bacterium]|nr:hypothetical protein [Rhodobacterales bacterium]
MENPLNRVTEAVENQLEMMSPRDRKMLLGLFSFGSVVFIGFFCYTLYGIIDDKAGQVRAAKAELATVQMLQSAAVAANQQLVDQETRLKQYQGKRLSAHVEELATKRGLNDQLRNVNETSIEVIGTMKQTRYKVELKGINYEDAIGFLYDLETSGYPASVDLASFKATTVKREKKINLTLELIVFSLADA